MEPLGPSLGLEPGDYTISVTADRATSTDGSAACSGFPDALLTRSYTATIASDPTQPSLVFQATLQLNNPAPFITSMGFGLGIAGNAVGFTIDGPAISEILPGYTYLEIIGSAPTDVPATSTGSGISIPFSGSFVVLRSEIADGYPQQLLPHTGGPKDRVCTVSFHPRRDGAVQALKTQGKAAECFLSLVRT